ncbi:MULTISPECIES: hypothetical protein [unclassified Pannonibacter]|uniref:hypothetical protein n=1 Tax=unclassified Pannonibacter TaxID=2627228 RepID=UPI001643FE2B|nr:MULTISPECIES: hypothetical protein [unclassified Pannonibacter]
MNPQDIKLELIADNEWGNVVRVDLEVSMEMQDDYEAAFADQDMDPGSLYTMDVAIQMDNGEVSLVHVYEEGPLYEFEKELFAVYKDALGAQASRMVAEMQADDVFSFVFSGSSHDNGGDTYYTVNVPVPEHIAHEWQRNEGIPATKTHAIDVVVSSDGDIGLRSDEPKELDRQLFLFHEGKLKASAPKEMVLRPLEGPKPPAGLKKPGERSRQAKSFAM